MLKDSLGQRKFRFPHPQPGTNIFIVVVVGNLAYYNANFMSCLSLIYSYKKILFGGFCIPKYDGVLGSLFKEERSLPHSRIQKQVEMWPWAIRYSRRV